MNGRRTVGLVIGFFAVGGLAMFSQPGSYFSPHEKAFYAAKEAVEFVRPGLVFQITSANVAADGTVTARVKMTDPLGAPLDRDGVLTPGAVSTSFVVARIPKGGRFYQAYTTRIKSSTYSATLGVTAKQSSADTGGRYVKVSDGVYDYVFGTKLPAGYQANATHSIGVYGSRNLTEFSLGTNYASNVYSFVPDGSPIVEVRDVINDQSCNRCHDELNFHGGSRRGLATCILCHTPGYDDVDNINPETGNVISMPVMIHKIHMGSLLPSVKAGKPYQIVGFGNVVSDFSKLTIPSEANNCAKCHDTSATQSNTYLTKPSRAACGACHDNVNFATGAGHANGLPQANDNNCARCHIPQGDSDFDSSIAGAHIDPAQSSLIGGVVVSIVSVENTIAGQRPVVTFTVKDRNGNPLNLTLLNRIAFTLAGPTTDYGEGIPATAGVATESAAGATAVPSGWRYTFSQAIPATARGSYTIAAEARRQEVALAGTSKERTIQTGSPNVTIDFSVDGSAVQPRRKVVDLSRCNGCHRSLSVHGENRNTTEYCVVCHNPRQTDAARRPGDKAPAEGIDFSLLIHRIHAAKRQTRDLTIWGFGPTANDFGDVVFPGDLTNCENCHLPGTSAVPVEAKLDKTDPRGFITPVKPATAACGGCHTSVDAASHALVNTSMLGESCGACHGEGKEFAVSKVHAQ